MKKVFLVLLLWGVVVSASENLEKGFKKFGMCGLTCPQTMAVVNAELPEYPNNKCAKCFLKTYDHSCLAAFAMVECSGCCIKQIAQHWIAPITGALFNVTFTRREEWRTTEI